MADEVDCSIYFYDGNLAAAIVFAIIYAIPTAYLFWQVFSRRAWFFICVPIGGLMEVAGYIVRSISVENPCDVAAYASSSSLIVIAPLLIAAGNYLMIGRLILAVLPPASQKIIGIRPTQITKIFVCVDVLTIMVQASGSGIASSNDWTGNMKDVGVNVLIVGLATQLVNIVVFLGIVAVFARRAVWGGLVRDSAPEGWENVLKAILISCVLITIRSVYRLIEFALGIEGYPFRNEWMFYVLEAVPMLPAIAVFCFWFPPRYIPLKMLGDDNGETLQERKRGDDA